MQEMHKSIFPAPTGFFCAYQTERPVPFVHLFSVEASDVLKSMAPCWSDPTPLIHGLLRDLLFFFLSFN